jgi:PilZ domain
LAILYRTAGQPTAALARISAPQKPFRAGRINLSERLESADWAGCRPAPAEWNQSHRLLPNRTVPDGRFCPKRVRLSHDHSKDPKTGRRMRCWGCGREAVATPSDLRRFTVSGFPQCCGVNMQAVAGVAPPSPPTHPNRLGRRWLARSSVRAEVRRPGPPAGPDLGAGLIDVSTDGACVRLTAPVAVGEAIRVRLRRRGARTAVEVPADVRWCRPEGGGVFLAGIRLKRPLTPVELALLAR